MGDWKFDLSGSHLALDFANTVSQRHTDRPIERLASYSDLVEFARQTRLIAEEEARELRERAASRPEEAAAVVRQAVELREALYGIFAATARGEEPRRPDLQVLNGQLARFRLDEGFRWEWASRPGGLDSFLGAILRPALDLLTSGPRDRIRICAADDCVWVFLDSSKNRSRRWCDMTQCGNRAKARRHYQRTRGRPARAGA